MVETGFGRSFNTTARTKTGDTAATFPITSFPTTFPQPHQVYRGLTEGGGGGELADSQLSVTPSSNGDP